MTNSLQTLGQSKPLYPVLQQRVPSLVHSINASLATTDSPATMSSFSALRALSQSQPSENSTTTTSLGQRVTQGASKNVALEQLLKNRLHDFNPLLIDLNHPIHAYLDTLCKGVLRSCEKMPLNKKIGHCEQAIAEIAQNAAEQYGLLDIAVRSHFYQGMLDQQTSEIMGVYNSRLELPKDLFEQENALLEFVEKNPQSHAKLSVALFGSFLKHFIDQSPDISSNKSMEQSIESYNHFIQDKLSNFDRAKLKSNKSVVLALELLESNPYTWKNFEFKIRQELASRLISRQAAIFKAQFKNTGMITPEEMKEAANAILVFAPNNQTSISCVSPLQELLRETFDVKSSDSFVELLRETFNKTETWLQQVATGNSKGVKGFLTGLTRLTYKPVVTEKEREDRAAHARRQLDTLIWAGNEWKEILLWNEWMERVMNSPSSIIHETPPQNEEEYEMTDEDYKLLFEKIEGMDLFQIINKWNY